MASGASKVGAAKWASVLGMVLGLAACASSSDPPATGSADGVAALDLTGTWVSNCEQAVHTAGSASFTSYDVRTRTFDGSQVTMTNLDYNDDATCKAPTVSRVVQATYSIGASVAGIDGAYEFDGVVSKVTITPLSDAWTMRANQMGACGIQDWATRVPRDLTAPCALIEGLGPNVDLYDIIKVTGSGFQMGENSQTVAAQRPTSLDSLKTYVKQ
jgi:hypothetical protein